MKFLHKLTLLLASTCIVCFACSRGQEQAPANVMDTATTTRFLTEMYAIEGYYAVATNNQFDSLYDEMKLTYDILLDKYGLTYTQLDSTLNYYNHHPKLNDSIYSRVLRNINRELSRQ